MTDTWPALRSDFFRRPAPIVARQLLGKFLVRCEKSLRKTVLSKPGLKKYFLITETEAYHGFKDLASHARRGRTPRNQTMFGPPGRWYVYFVYGNHWMLNVVTANHGVPSAVLIRGVLGVNGPGRVTKRLAVGNDFNGRKSLPSSGLYLAESRLTVPSWAIRRGPRIGVGYAGPLWAKKPWRFFITVK